MRSLNRVQLIGVVQEKLPVVGIEDNRQILNIVIKTDYSYTNKRGERKMFEESSVVAFWNDLSKMVDEMLDVGDTVFIEGRLQTRFYKDKEGKEERDLMVLGERFILLNKPHKKY